MPRRNGELTLTTLVPVMRQCQPRCCCWRPCNVCLRVTRRQWTLAIPSCPAGNATRWWWWLLSATLSWASYSPLKKSAVPCVMGACWSPDRTRLDSIPWYLAQA